MMPQLRGNWDIMLNAVVQDRYLPHVRGLRGLWAYTVLGKLVWGSQVILGISLPHQLGTTGD